MQESSSGGSRNPRSSRNRSNGGRQRSRNRRPDGRNPESRRDSARWKSQPDEFRPSEIVGRNRRREPKTPQLTGFQKFIKFITFGLVDPSAKKTAPKKDRPARDAGEKRTKREPKSGSAGKEATSAKRERRAPHYVEPTSPRLYVGNLSFDVTSADLEVLFAAHGSVVEAAVVTRSGTDKSKGFAFVEMGTVEEAKAAAAALNDHELQGRKMLVTGAKSEGAGEERSADSPRSERPARSSSGRGERRGRGERPRGESDEIDKPSRQVRPLVIETVTSPCLNVRNVNAEAGEQDLADLFAGIGSIVSREETGPGKDDRTKNHRIDLADTAEAQKAVELLHGKCFMGHEIQVSGAATEV